MLPATAITRARTARADPAAVSDRTASAALWRRALPDVAGIAALSLLLWLVYGSGYVDYDAVYALMWGEDIAHGRAAVDIAAVHSPTSHPLDTMLAALLAPLGKAAALTGLQTVSIVSFGALGWSAYRFGSRLFVPVVGAVFAGILVTRPILVHQALTANVDIPFLALVLAAATLEAGRTRRGAPVLALLAVAGLLRPEAWLLSAAYLVWLWPAVSGRGRAVAVALALAGPVLWGAFDLIVAGSPLHSVTGTRRAATRIGRPQGIDRAIRLTPTYGAKFLQVLPTLVGLVAMVAALRWERRRALLPVAIGAVGLAAFLFLGLGRQPLLARYLAIPASMLALFCAAAVGARFVPSVQARLGGWATAVSLAAAAALLVAAVQVTPAVRDTVDQAKARHRADGDLPGLVGRERAAFEGCRPLQTAFFQTRPLLAYLLDEPANDIVRVRADRAVSGTVLAERDSAPPPPPAFRPVAQDRSWRLLSTCRVGA
ncbi:MAG: hypothetical protein ACXW08_14140 [Solirubrobacteraceae bacterium]